MDINEINNLTCTEAAREFETVKAAVFWELKTVESNLGVPEAVSAYRSDIFHAYISALCTIEPCDERRRGLDDLLAAYKHFCKAKVKS